MLKTAVKKVKKSCCVVFIPKILQGELKIAQENATNRTFEVLSRLKKSTDSGTDEEYEKKIRIIEKCFAPKAPFNETKQEPTNCKDNVQSINQPEYKTETSLEKSHRIIAKLFGNSENNINVTEIGKKSSVDLDNARVQATTSKQPEEKLAQKIESIDEISVVEADASRPEGFNIPPKILSHDVETLNLSQKNYNNLQTDYDDIAKRCLNTPINDVDMGLLRELRRMSRSPTVASTESNDIAVDTMRNYCEENYFGDVLYNFNKKTPLGHYNKDDEKMVFGRTSNTSVFDKTFTEEMALKDNVPSEANLIDKSTFSSNKCNITKGTNNIDMVRNYCEENYFGDVFYKCNKETVLGQNNKDGEQIIFRQALTNADTKQDETLTKEKALKDEFQCNVNLSDSSTFLSNKCNFTEDSKNNVNLIIKEITNETGLIQESSERTDTESVYVHKGIVYSKFDNATGEIPQSTPQSNQYEGYIFPNTAISGTLPIPSPRSLERQHDTSISANQELDVFRRMVISEAVFHSAENIERLNEDSPVVQNFYSTRLNSIQTSEDTNYNFGLTTKEITNEFDEPSERCEFEIEGLDIEKGSVYSKIKNPVKTIPYTPDQSNQRQENVIRNTAISGTLATPSLRNLGHQHDIAISTNQRLDEFSQMTLSKAVFHTAENTDRLAMDSPVVQNIFSTQLNFNHTNDKIESSYPYLHPISQNIFEIQLKSADEIEQHIQTELNFIESKLSTASGSSDIESPPIPQNIPLTEMLKIVRRRNHIERCRDFLVKTKEDVKMKNPPCIPLDTSGKPKDTLGPPPCPPKPKEGKTKCPSPCGPKKDPCAKFSTILDAVFQNVSNMCLNLNFPSNCHVHNYIVHRNIGTTTVLNDKIIDENLYARDFEPWTPIPSWPIPKKEEKKRFVCPKEGCKLVPPPNLWGPCDKNPCQGVPAFPKRRYSTTLI